MPKPVPEPSEDLDRLILRNVLARLPAATATEEILRHYAGFLEGVPDDKIREFFRLFRQGVLTAIKQARDEPA